MTRKEQLQAAGAIEIVAKRRKDYDYKIGSLIEKLREEIEGAISEEKFIASNPHGAGKSACEGNLCELREAYDRIYDLYVDIAYGDETYRTDY